MLHLFSSSFIINAFISGFLATGVANLTGSILSIRKMTAMIGGIAHASLAGIGLFAYLGWPPLLGAGIVSVLLSVFLAYLYDKEDKLKIFNSETMINSLWSVGAALGVLFLHLIPGYKVDLMSYLFGNILLVSVKDLFLLVILDGFVLIFYFFYFRQLISMAVDKEYATMRGVPVRFLHYSFFITVGLSIILLTTTVGLILCIALFSLPYSTAKLISLNYSHNLIIAQIISLLAVFWGIILSMLFNFPSGAVIVLFLSTIYLIVYFTHICYKKRLE